MSMKRLFVLRHSKGGTIVKGDDGQPLYFDNKPTAKSERDRIGGSTVVSLGPDHKLSKGI